MAIIKIVRGNGDGAPRRVSRRLIWFVLIWASSTAGFIAAASLLHLLIPK